MKRVTVTLDPVDVDLLDRLARLGGSNRSSELRTMLQQVRPMLAATVRAFEAAAEQREAFDKAAAQFAANEFGSLLPEVERISNAYLGAVSRLEGRAAAEQNPRGGNTGVTPPDSPTSSSEGSEG